MLQFLLEITIEVIVYCGFEKSWMRNDNGTGCVYVSCLVLLAAGLAGFTNLVHPRLLLPNETLRLLNLIGTPLVIGGLVYWMTWLRRTRGEKMTPLFHAIAVGLFLLVYGVVRYAWGTH